MKGIDKDNLLFSSQLTDKFKCQWIVKFIVGCSQSIYDRANACISWYQDESHTCRWIKLRIGRIQTGNALKHYQSGPQLNCGFHSAEIKEKKKRLTCLFVPITNYVVNIYFSCTKNNLFKTITKNNVNARQQRHLIRLHIFSLTFS